MVGASRSLWPLAAAVAVLLVAATALAESMPHLPDASSASSSAGMPGGWSKGTAGANETKLLETVLADDKYYRATVKTRLCATEIVGLEKQVVAGMNYRYTVRGCAVSAAKDGGGKCSATAAANCKPELFEVQVFEQVWTNTREVTEIKSSGATTPSKPGSGGGDVTGAPVVGASGTSSGAGGKDSVETPGPSKTTTTQAPKPSTTKANDATMLASSAMLIATATMVALTVA